MTSTGVAIAAAAASPAGAMAAECPVTPTTQAFATYGDANQYFLAPGGSFESLGDWSSRGTPALLSGGNLLGLSAGSKSVDLDWSDGVTSVSFCVDATMPHLRFTARSPGNGPLEVTVRTEYVEGGSQETDSDTDSISADDHRAWAPSRYVALRTADIPAGESGTATVAFCSRGDWQIDDVFVDPYRR